MKEYAAQRSQPTAWTWRRRSIIAVAVMALLGALGVGTPQNSLAAGPLPSSTALSVKPASSTSGTAVTLKATIKVLGLNGLGITPTGSVSFSATNGSATAQLGSARVSPCLLTPCTATLTTSSIPVGTTKVTASYGGDGLVGPSSKTVAATVTSPPVSPSATVTCYSGQPCDTGTVKSSPTAMTSLDVSSPASSNTQSLSASMASGQLHCALAPGGPDGDGDDDDPGPFPGDLATFSGTATDVGKTIRYTGTGTVGALMKHQFLEHVAFAGCFGSTSEFSGYTAGVYGPAPFDAQDGLFEGQLPSCATHSGQQPCVTNVVGSGQTDSYVVSAPIGDPKFIG